MGGVAKALRDLISQWHGREYGSIKALAAAIHEHEGTDVYHRLHRELSGRPSWKVVEWVVAQCVPEDPDARLQSLAGQWYMENQRRMPPGYAGRVVLDGTVVRDRLSAAEEAEDLLTRARLLSQERAEAEETLKQQRVQIRDLQGDVEELSSEIQRLNGGALDQARVFSRTLDGLVERLDVVQRELDRSTTDTRRLTQEIDSLRQAESHLRRERDHLRDELDERYRQIQEIRRSAEDEQQRLIDKIRELESEIMAAQRTLSTVRETSALAVEPDDGHPLRGGVPWDGVLRRRKG